MADLVHFEIRSRNVSKAKNFFENVLGLSFENYGSSLNKYFYIKNVGGDFLKATLIEDVDPCIVNTFKVEKLVETLKKVKVFGGTILVKKTAVPSLGFIAYFKDLDGNIFGLVEENKLAI